MRRTARAFRRTELEAERESGSSEMLPMPKEWPAHPSSECDVSARGAFSSAGHGPSLECRKEESLPWGRVIPYSPFGSPAIWRDSQTRSFAAQPFGGCALVEAMPSYSRSVRENNTRWGGSRTTRRNRRGESRRNTDPAGSETGVEFPHAPGGRDCARPPWGSRARPIWRPRPWRRDGGQDGSLRRGRGRCLRRPSLLSQGPECP